MSGQPDYIHETIGNSAFVNNQPGYIHETTANGVYIGGQADYIHETAPGSTYFRSYDEPMDLMFVNNQV